MANIASPSDAPFTTPAGDAAQPGPAAPSPAFTLTFWGVRGNIPSPGADTVRYGGNTACVEVQVGGQRLIFDGGTGLWVLGRHLMAQGQPVSAHLFFTHTHWDRIQGFPFFSPAFAPATRLDIYGAQALNGASIKQRLMEQMLRPNFFKPLQTMAAAMTFHNIAAGEPIALADVLVEPWSLNRHTSALGYRVSWGDRVLVYATDTDPTQTSVDPNLLMLASGADVLIFDGTYADAAYSEPNGSGLAPWHLGIEVAQASQVKHLVLFHHNPCHSDDQLDQLELQVQDDFAHASLAREGMTLDLISGCC
ncbi:MBL fold metallo-hydrolase [Leptolyngbya sp. CCNP1308]|uniref:MBL fold metallo-hydrolase n=1 Tax=Leptolyngbya sp. CCNP1308 TaxID=3110255 RepID=UPI002B1EED14|nr:MBL fold metallo-hydrolase [Leptolyngbya sp. CCNP1308]MEA5450227.1 MBL fold metallo-hydrolase [Leptolyngbya sp. CCNP1308]